MKKDMTNTISNNNKQLFFAFSALIIFLQLSCGQNKKIDLSTIEIDANWTVEHNPSQSIDSIIIFNSANIIKNTGDTIYRITTHAENRRLDSLRDVEKKLGHPINPFSPSEMTHQGFTINENSNFSIIAYDTLGNEALKFVDDKFQKGVYEVYFAIYSILTPGTYILKMSNQLVEQHIKLKVKDIDWNHKNHLEISKVNPVFIELTNLNHGQTLDSIIIFNTGKVITTTGDSIYNITTKAEKRRLDSLNEIQMKQKYPNPFSPPTLFLPYDVSEEGFFSITVYDSLGNKLKQLVNANVPKGEYWVYFDIYSVLPAGVFYSEVSTPNEKRIQKYKIK